MNSSNPESYDAENNATNPMIHSKIEQIGTPYEVYENPKTLFVADFLGESNIFDGEIVNIENGKCTINTKENLELFIRNEDFEIGDKVHIIVRPEKIKISNSSSRVNCMQALVYDGVYDGAFIKTLVKVGKKVIKQVSYGTDKRFNKNDLVYISWSMEDCIVIKEEQNEK